MSLELLLAANKCSQCLISKNRIVNARRAAEIIEGCREQQIHFVCHKGTEAGLNLHCRGFHDLHPSLSFRMAETLHIPIIEIDPDTLERK